MDKLLLTMLLVGLLAGCSDSHEVLVGQRGDRNAAQNTQGAAADNGANSAGNETAGDAGSPDDAAGDATPDADPADTPESPSGALEPSPDTAESSDDSDGSDSSNDSSDSSDQARNEPSNMGPITAPAGSGQSWRIERSPFRLCFNSEVCTAAAPAVPLPMAYDYSELTRPRVNPSTIDAFPAFGWVVGRSDNQTINRFIWQGNRKSGHDSGILYQATRVASVERRDGRTIIKLDTDYAADPTPATLTIQKLASGALKLHVTPPPGMRDAGIAATLFTIDSPPSEGLFGMGARKDYFDQRGKLRNVWTEQQNTGIGGPADLDLSGAGLPTGLPTADLLDRLGLNPDLDDKILLQDRSSFPNGAQAAYWVEAYLVGSRGWAAWTAQPHFQRLDLAATREDKIRWQIVDSDVVDLLFAGGGLASASRTYTNYQGRAAAPPRFMFKPWFDTINQGEGEAAPNGPGFFGGERARCDVLDFIAKTKQYDIPLGVVGIEGWQVVPRGHPDIQTRSNAAICAEVASDADSYAADDAHFKPGTNAAGDDFFDYLREDQALHIAGYWNFFHADPKCAAPGQDPEKTCASSVDVPKASKLAYYTAKRNGYFVDDAQTGDDAQINTNRGGTAYILDFTNPEVFGFWRSQIVRLFERDIELFMHDFGELTTYKMAFDNGENATVSHNLYALDYQKAGRRAVAAYKTAHEASPDKDLQPYFYSRAGMTGACAATPAVFPGDETTTWDKGHGLPSVIPAMLNLSLSGCYLFTTDIGGYFDFAAPRTSEDLFIRWSQLAALTPVMRIHNSTFHGSVYPWTWREGDADKPAQYDTIEIFRRYAKLKTNLIPLVTHWTAQAARNGTIGPIRPLILVDDSQAAMQVDYEWLLGQDILVAPVVEQDARERSVYFPSGSAWRRVIVGVDGRFAPTNQIYAGGGRDSIGLAGDLSDIPIFLRCGASNDLVPIADGIPACPRDATP